ncbi:hypothetical protein FAF44_13520 [Nonomuraea sp. MG754425]|uniref:hypothetical protein n=1 Tax=Nonomuraea sp. MG754425 TaxID=2570319 RepID=UPI001F487E5F|nr:hypothetical protein [Nonomuraea sp. MG754425]MCF6469403.1 hypothetical protein [Nonomuraea sp. MG754425]
MTISDIVRHVRRTSVLLQSFRWTARQTVRLAAPALLVSLPVAVVVLLAAVPLAGDAGTLVNGEFALLTPLPGPSVGWTVALLVVWILSQAVVLPATVLMAAGPMLGRAVPPSVALRTALRRAPAMLAAGALMLLEGVAIGAAGLGVAWVTHQDWLSILVMAVLAVAAVPCLLAVPALILEGRPGWRALGRGHRLAGGRPAYVGVTLLVGVLGLPALAWQGPDLLPPLLPDSIAAAVTGVVFAVVSVLVGAFQAVVVVRMFLLLVSEAEGEAAFEAIVRLLPDAPPTPARPVRVLAALTLPGLLYGGVVLVNPLGWVEVAETNVTGAWTRGSQAPGGGGRTASPTYVDLRALYSGTDRTLTMLMDSTESPTNLLTCADSGCRDTTFMWAKERSQVGPVAGSARLADGRLVLAVWRRDLEADDPARRIPVVRLGLLICDRDGCAAPQEGEPLSEPTDYAVANSVALAVRPNGGLVVVQTRRNGSASEDDSETVSFTFCDDPICSRPERRMSAGLDAAFGDGDERSLTLVVGPDDRPVAARADSRTGAMSVIACAEATCATPLVTTPVQGRRTADADYRSRKRGSVSMAVRTDGQPVIVRRDVLDDSISLLDCRDRTCAQLDRIAPAGPSRLRSLPALALDGDGRALVAYQDPGTRLIMLAACSGGTCETTAVTSIRYGAGRGVAMTLDDRGRPVIAWVDDNGGRERGWALKVTTVLDAGNVTTSPAR